MTDLIGQSINHYHVIEQLGEGGMATVYKAFDTHLERYVAIKVIRTDMIAPSLLHDLLKRFEREAKVLASFSHPNIVNIYDYGEHNGAPYLVMEYVSGGTIKDRIDKPLNYKDAVRMLLPVAHALIYAHQKNVVHRDVKPANILISESGEIKLSDFGVAKVLAMDQATQLTGTGVGIGTPDYMAPEQWVGEVTHLSDQYALGIIFYEMVTGCKPFLADTPAAILIKQMNDPLPRPREIMPDLPDAVEQVLFKALAKQPQDRYPDMGAFAIALENLVLENAPTQSLPKPDVVTQKALRPSVGAQNKRNLLIAGGLFCMVIFVLLAYWVKTNIYHEQTPTSSIAGIVLYDTPTPTTAAGPTDQPSPTQTVLPTLPSTPTATVIPLENAFTNPKDGGEWVIIPAGSFQSGLGQDQINFLYPLCPGCEDLFDASQPVHSVELDTYWIDKYEVSNSRYKICVDAGVCPEPDQTNSYTIEDYFENPNYSQYPVIYVSWYDARQFCEWAGGRLPTEAEWEKAARGSDRRLFPWGNQEPDNLLANVDNFIGELTAVNSFAKGVSPYGIYQMTGNVWEWTADWWDSDFYGTNSDWKNPQGSSSPGSTEWRVGRGGAWYHSKGVSSVAIRDGWEPEKSANGVGFRCVYDQLPVISSTVDSAQNNAMNSPKIKPIYHLWTLPGNLGCSCSTQVHNYLRHMD